MALKTLKNNSNVADFVAAIEDDTKRNDSLHLIKLFTDITGHQPVMWGTAIIGFGEYHYKSQRSSQEGDWPLVGFSPRKTALSLYLSTGFEQSADLLATLGKHKIGKGCLYIKQLSDVDESVLKQIIDYSYNRMKKDWS